MRQQWQEFPVEVIPENSLDLYKRKKSRRAATQADIVRREQGKPTYSELQKEQTKNKENCTKASSKNEKEFAYEDIKDLTPYELYNLMFGDKR